jgi:Ser/Thr protein kinase RdoA (MazF antagonist)
MLRPRPEGERAVIEEIEPDVQARAALGPQFWQQYPSLLHPIQTPEVHSTGLSGAIIWKASTKSGDIAVRRFGPKTSRSDVQILHDLLTQARRLSWHEVPQPFPANDGSTVVEHAGSHWDLCSWQPGEPSTLPISDGRLRSSMHLIARWHGFWTRENTGTFIDANSNAVLRRQTEWRRLTDGKSFREAAGGDLARRTFVAIEARRRRLEELFNALPLVLAAEPLVFTHGDLHREHILFTDDMPTGLIDLSCRWDYAAADLARWLPSVAEPNRWPHALEWYREKAPMSTNSERAIPMLAATGLTIAALRWKEWLLGSEPYRRYFPNLDLANRRWQEVIESLERLEL